LKITLINNLYNIKHCTLIKKSHISTLNTLEKLSNKNI